MNKPEPAPTRNENPAIWSLVIRDMADRDAEGASKYGTRLQPHNGRDPLVDAYQEALDLAVYLRQAIWERDNPVRSGPEPCHRKRFYNEILTDRILPRKLGDWKGEARMMTDREKILQNALEKLLALASCPGDLPVKVVKNICEEAFNDQHKRLPGSFGWKSYRPGLKNPEKTENAND